MASASRTNCGSWAQVVLTRVSFPDQTETSGRLRPCDRLPVRHESRLVRLASGRCNVERNTASSESQRRTLILNANGHGLPCPHAAGVARPLILRRKPVPAESSSLSPHALAERFVPRNACFTRVRPKRSSWVRPDSHARRRPDVVPAPPESLDYNLWISPKSPRASGRPLALPRRTCDHARAVHSHKGQYKQPGVPAPCARSRASTNHASVSLFRPWRSNPFEVRGPRRWPTATSSCRRVSAGTRPQAQGRASRDAWDCRPSASAPPRPRLVPSVEVERARK